MNDSQLLSPTPSNDQQTACEDILTVSSSTIKFRTVCIYCKATRRARKSDQLKRGSHLVFSRGVSLCPVFERHAIATEVHPRDSQKVKVKLIEFKKENGILSINDSHVNEFDLTKDKLFVTTHKDKPYSSSQIVSRAKTIREEYNNSDYNQKRLFTSNSEQCVTHCILGLPVSLQIDSVLKHFWRSFAHVLSRGFRFLIYATMLLHGVILLWTDLAFQILSSVNLVAYLLITIYRLDKNYKKQINCKLCRKCGFAYRKRLKAEIAIFVLVWIVDLLFHFLLVLEDYDDVLLSVGWCAGGFACYIVMTLVISLYYSKRKRVRLSCA